MSDNPYESSQTSEASPATASGIGGIVLKIFAVLFVLGIVVMLLLPTVRGARGAGRRAQCTNNLKQIALALHAYAEKHGAFPPAYTVDAEGKPLHSWRTLILPFLEQHELYEKLDLTKPWDDPVNRAAYDSRVSIYHCPSLDITSNHTTYLAVTTDGGCFAPGEPRKLADIKDATSLTMMVIDAHSKHQVHWMSPHDMTEPWSEYFGEQPKQQHPGIVLAAFVDGSVMYVLNNTKSNKLRAMLTIAGGDDAEAAAEDP
jgi:type II secretory pathway pseudopilin PulG